VLLGLVLLGYVILRVVGVDLPTTVGSVTLGQIVLGIAGAALLFVLIKVIAGATPAAIPSTSAVTITKTRKFGIYVGLLSTAGLFVGAILSLQAEQLGAT
jgi:hypothetical protein